MRRGEMWPSVLSRRSANDFSGIRSNVHSDVVIAEILVQLVHIHTQSRVA